MSPAQIRSAIETTVEKWLRDNGVIRDNSHDQLVSRLVAAVVATEETQFTESNRFACGD